MSDLITIHHLIVRPTSPGAPARIALLLILIFLIHPSTSPARAQTACAVYVNASDGADSNPGTLTQPLRSLERALDRLSDNEAACVAAGEYFRGDDADGVSITGGGRNITMVLNSFAGEPSVRISGANLILDLPGGSLTIAAGTGSNLVFGSGVLNDGGNDFPGAMESFVLRAGTLRLDPGVNVVIEDVVGSMSGTDARIELGDGSLDGFPVISPSARRILLTNSAPRAHSFVPDPGIGGQLVHRSGAATVVSSDLDLTGATFTSESDELLTFSGNVRLEPSSSTIDGALPAARLEFASRLELAGPAGHFMLQVAELTIGDLFVAESGAWPVSLLAVSGHLAEITGVPGAIIELDLSGTFSLGVENAPADRNWSGFLRIRSGTATVWGNTSITGSTPFMVDASAVLQTGNGFLDPATEGARITVAGTVTSTSGAVPMEISRNATIELTGTLFGVRAVGARLDVQGSGNITSVLSLESGARMVVDGSFSGRASLGVAQSEVELAPGARLETSSFQLTESIARLSTETELHVLGSAFFDSGSTFPDPLGSIVFRTGADSFEEHVAGALPDIVSMADNLDVSASGPMTSLRIERGATRVSTGGASIQMGGLSVRSSSLSVHTGNQTMRLTGGMELTDAAVDLQEVGRLEASGVLRIQSSQITWPDSGLAAGTDGVLDVRDSDPVVLPDLLFDEEGANVRIATDVTVEKSLNLEQGQLVVDSGSTLTLLASLSRTNGRFEPVAGGRIRFADPPADGPTGVLADVPTERTISGFTTSVLPSIEVAGSHVTLAENGTILGNLLVLSGSFALGGSRTLLVSGDVELEGGLTELAPGSSLFASNSLTVLSATFSLSKASLRTGRNLHIGLSADISGIATELRVGGSLPSTLTFEQPFEVTDFVVGGASRVQVTGERVRVERTFRVENGAALDLQSSIRHAGADAAPEAINNGSISGTGSLIFTGPGGPFGGVLIDGILPSHTLQGTGTWGPIEIDLADPDAVVVASPGSEPVRLAGGITFTRGGLDLSGRPVLLASPGNTDLPRMTLRLTSSPGHGGLRDGRGLINSSGAVQILPESRYELAYTGDVASLSEPGNELVSGLVHSLDVDIRDAVNNPPVFGLSIARSLDLSGSLHIRSGSLVRLDGADIELAGSGVIHTLEGRLSGPGRLFISAPGTQLRGLVGSPSRVGRLNIDVPIGSAEVVLMDMAATGILTLTRGNVALESATPFAVGALEMTGGRLRIAQQIAIGSGGQLSIQAGQIQLDTGSRIRVLDAVPVTIQSPVDWSVTSPRDMDGYLELAGSHSVSIRTELPRIRLDATPDGLHTVEIANDLTITGNLDQRAGQLSLGSSRLTLSGARWSVGPDFGSRPAVAGDASTQQAEVRFSSAVEIELHQDLRIFAAELISVATSLTLTQPSTVALARSLIVDGGRASLLAGSVVLGRSDIVITTSQAEALTLGPGLPPITGSGSEASRALPENLFNDDLFGEIVLTGSGSTSLAVAGSTVIPALRILGTTRILTTGGELSITNRMVFGERGANLLTARAGEVNLASGSIIVRRGKGTLTHTPSMDGDVHMAYDMDDGSWTGHDSGFVDATLTTGIELPAHVQSLTILAGNRGPSVNVLTLGTPITIAEHVRVLSGRFNTPTASTQMTVKAGATLTLGGVDPAAAASWTPGANTLFEGNLSLNASSFGSFDFTSSVLPESVPLDTARFALLSPSTSLRLARDIEATSIAVKGVDSSSRLRLNGHQILATDALSALNISISSSQTASFTSKGTLSVENGAVRENVQLRADGDLSLSAEISNLEIVAGGNLSVDESLFSPQRLTLTGSGKEWLVNGDVSVGRLRIDVPDGGPFTLRGPAATLRLTGTLELVSGVLVSQYVVTELTAPLPGFERVEGHVDGPVRRRVTAGDTDTILFPTGTRTVFMPISLTPGSGYISDAAFTAEARVTQAHERNGLPVTGPDGRILVDAARSVWSLTSTVNFAQSQPVTVSVSLPETPAGNVNSHQLIRRQRLHASPWLPIPGTPVFTGTTTGLLVRHIDAPGMLSPSGFEVGVGTGTLLSAQSAESQVVNLTAEPVTIRTGEGMFNLTSGAASALWTGGLPPGVQAIDWMAESAQGHELDLESIGDAGRTGLAVLLPPGNSGDIPLQVMSSWATPVGTSNVDLAFVHAWPGGPTVELSLSGTLPILLGALSAGETTGTVPLDPGSLVLTAAYGPPENSTETYVLDLVTSSRPTAVLLLRETALLVLRSGEVRNLAIPTGVNTPDAGSQLPTTLRVHPIYPNPVRGRATIPVDVPSAASVRLTLVDMLGREVRRVDAGRLAAGQSQLIRVDATGLAAGTYLYVVEAAAAGQTWRETGTMTVLR